MTDCEHDCSYCTDGWCCICESWIDNVCDYRGHCRDCVEWADTDCCECGERL